MDGDLEADLVAKARRGDPSAAPFLVSCYGERLLGYARAHAPDLSDADREQIVELSIEAAVRAIDRFDSSKGSLESWFRGQIRFQTLGWRRRMPKATGTTLEIEEPVRHREFESHTSEALRSALARLSREDQHILALRNAERIAFAEIGQRLDITEEAARQRHRRALGRLRSEAAAEPGLEHLAKEVDK